MQHEGWQPSGMRSGCVALPNQAGAAASVEAAWTPTMPGLLPVPQLHLRDVAHQELSDDTGSDLVRVEPAEFHSVSL